MGTGRTRLQKKNYRFFVVVAIKYCVCRGAAMAMSAKEQMSKMLDQLMGQNRDGEFDH